MDKYFEGKERLWMIGQDRSEGGVVVMEESFEIKERKCSRYLTEIRRFIHISNFS